MSARLMRELVDEAQPDTPKSVRTPRSTKKVKTNSIMLPRPLMVVADVASNTPRSTKAHSPPAKKVNGILLLCYMVVAASASKIEKSNRFTRLASPNPSEGTHENGTYSC